MRHAWLFHVSVLAAIAFGLTTLGWAGQFEEARIYIEYNATDNDRGFHVSLDGPNWETAQIVNPAGITIFDVAGKGGYQGLGLTELFFEGAEPSPDEFPLADLLARFPEGKYKFFGAVVGGGRLFSAATLSHAVPAGPSVSTEVAGDTVTIRWDPVTGPPAGFPDRTVTIVGYQVIVGTFQVTLPATSTEVTLPRVFVDSLKPGAHGFEVLAIEANGNQTITADSFEIE